PDRRERSAEVRESVDRCPADFALLDQTYGLERERREGGEGATRARTDQENDRLARTGERHQPECEAAEDVDRERADRVLALEALAHVHSGEHTERTARADEVGRIDRGHRSP